MSAVFVTGTGTEIGKTFVTAALIHEFRRRGRGIDALKPVASGIDDARLVESDPGLLLAALGKSIAPAAIDRIAPWRFRAPLSPNMAAAREGRAIAFPTLLAFCQERIAADAAGLLLIEGVGGIMVPLDETHTTLDWMTSLRIPLLLVAGSYLGAISHALSALAVLRQRALAVAALVVNETLGSTVPLAETAPTIARFAEATPVVSLPRLARCDVPHPAVAHLADLIAPDASTAAR